MKHFAACVSLTIDKLHDAIASEKNPRQRKRLSLRLKQAERGIPCQTGRHTKSTKKILIAPTYEHAQRKLRRATALYAFICNALCAERKRKRPVNQAMTFSTFPFLTKPFVMLSGQKTPIY